MDDLRFQKPPEKPNPDWQQALNRFHEVIASGTKAMQVRAVLKLAHLSTHAPIDILSYTVPVLAKLLDDNNAANFPIQQAAIFCLKCIACRGDGKLATEIGLSGVVQSVLRLLPQSNAGFQNVLVKCLWSLVNFDEANRLTVARIGGLEIVVSMLSWRAESDSVRKYLLEILSALTLSREIRRVIISVGGLRFLVEAAKYGHMISRERACQAIGLIAVNRQAKRMLIDLGVIPVLVELFRDGDCNTKLVVGNSLGVISAHVDHIRLVSQAGAIPLYAQLLEAPDPISKQIAEDVFCILAIAEVNAVQIIEHLVRILQDGDEESKAAAVDVLWDISGYKHSISLLGDSCAIPTLVGLLRERNDEIRESASRAVAQLSYNELDRVALVDAGAVPFLIELLHSESEEMRDNATEALVNFSEDPLQRDRIIEVVDVPAFQSMQIRLAQLQASDELVVRSMRRLNIDQLTQDPDLI